MQAILDIDWPLWLTTMIPLALSAGPGNLTVAASGARSGIRRSVRFIAGLDATYLLLAMAAGLGLYHALMGHPRLLFWLRLAGSLYIAWLGIRMMVRPLRTRLAEPADLRFRDGVALQLGNVQGMVMLLVMFSTFTPGGAPGHAIVLALSLALVSLNFLGHMLWVCMGAAVQRSLKSRPGLLAAQNAAFGLMLVAVGVWIFARAGNLGSAA